jgi:choline-sulfatase
MEKHLPRTLDRRELLLGVGAAAGMARAAAGTRPNILHIMTDQQQWGTIMGRSECRTPHLDKLAKSGLSFERSYTPSAVCCPARAMLLSGAYHWHNGVYNQVHSPPSVHRDMNQDVVLYSDRLKAVGYRQGYVGKWHASQVRGPLDFSFDEIADLTPLSLAKHKANPDNVSRPKRKPRVVRDRMMQWPGSEPFLMWGHEEGGEEETDDYYRAECAIRMLKRFAKGSQPWHLETHFIQPHDPYVPLKKYLDRYDPRSIAVPKSFAETFAGKPEFHKRESETWGRITEDDYRQSRAHYYAYVEQVDAQIGRILDALDETGQADNTLVVFTADHGDMVGAHRMWIKGWIPYEEAYRVPLIVRWPGHTQPGSTTANLVSTHFLGHTYVQAAGAEKLQYADGASLLPLFENPRRTDWTDQILCAYYGGEFLYTQRIAITQRHKYVFNGFGIDECYDLENDPEEMRNIAESGAERPAVDDMRARMYELMNQYADPYGDIPQPDGTRRGDRYCAPRYLPRGKRI